VLAVVSAFEAAGAADIGVRMKCRVDAPSAIRVNMSGCQRSTTLRRKSPLETSSERRATRKLALQGTADVATMIAALVEAVPSIFIGGNS